MDHQTETSYFFQVLSLFHLLQGLYHFLKGRNFHRTAAAELSGHFSSDLPRRSTFLEGMAYVVNPMP